MTPTMLAVAKVLRSNRPSLDTMGRMKWRDIVFGIAIEVYGTEDTDNHRAFENACGVEDGIDR